MALLKGEAQLKARHVQMPIPDLTHLQYLILTSLLDGEQSGKYLRQQLAKSGAKKSGPAFYQLMARLEDGKHVKGWYDQKIVDGQIIKERSYKITGHGLRARQEVYAFYIEQASGVTPAIQGGLVGA